MDPKQSAADDSGKGGDQQSPSDVSEQGNSAAESSAENGEAAQSQDSEGETSDQASGAESGEQDLGKQGDGKPSDDESSQSESTDADAADRASRKQPAEQPTNAQSSAPSTDSSESKGDSGTGGEGESQGSDSGLPPEEANAEYAKRATDMVLDYLNETRDKPDRELLDKLNWGEDDLRRFAERWQKVREIADKNSDPKTNREINEALKSLGMRPKAADSKNNVRESADSLRSIRDSGNRKPPPAAYRDAFDAFRRAAGNK